MKQSNKKDGERFKVLGIFSQLFPRREKGRLGECFRGIKIRSIPPVANIQSLDSGQKQKSLFFIVVPKVRSSNSIMLSLFYPPPVRDKLVSLLDGFHQPV